MATIIIRKVDPAQVNEINRLAVLLEAASLFDVIELVCARVFRDRHVFDHSPRLGEYIQIDAATRAVIATVTTAVEAETTPDTMRAAALRVLSLTHDTTRRS